MSIKSNNKVSFETSKTAMTDFVFLMLIFFVILSTLINPGLPVELPSAQSGTSDYPSRVTVTITSDEQYFLGNTPISPETLEQKLAEELSREGVEQTVVLHVDQAVPTGVTVGVLDIAKRNSWKIALATKSQ